MNGATAIVENSQQYNTELYEAFQKICEKITTAALSTGMTSSAYPGLPEYTNDLLENISKSISTLVSISAQYIHTEDKERWLTNIDRLKLFIKTTDIPDPFTIIVQYAMPCATLKEEDKAQKNEDELKRLLNIYSDSCIVFTDELDYKKFDKGILFEDIVKNISNVHPELNYKKMNDTEFYEAQIDLLIKKYMDLIYKEKNNIETELPIGPIKANTAALIKYFISKYLKAFYIEKYNSVD